jgi:uncharacterized membrane protein
MMKLVHALNAMLLAALIGLSLYVYPEVPAEIPLHFGADGVADRWGGRTLLSWMMLPLIGTATVLLIYGVAALMPRRPQSFNMPDKRKLLELPPPLQRWVIAGASNMLHVMTLTLLIMFCGIQYGTWEAAQTRSGSQMIMASIIFSLVVTPFVTIGLLIVSQRRMDRAWRAHQAAAET